ncbi:MAG: nucleotidyltransferase domain-containing protein [Thermomicrobiales bacterium]|nr:nucleotidyltransferase domain-containing protein [Thermomicrobiales bacterium]MCO5227159.1 nucleotidyltransferase domain-containing protein [Thermomicrobiales bacterium]
MIPLVEEHLDDIIELCEKTELKGLWLFGSAATGNWDPKESDLDFLFDIGEYDHTAGRRSMMLSAGLERLFGENFDLVSRPAIRRPEFRVAVDRTAIPIYER